MIDSEFDGQQWEWVAEWRLAKDQSTDAEGWSYSGQFNSKSYSAKKGIMDMVRRRRWVRQCVSRAE